MNKDNKYTTYKSNTNTGKAKASKNYKGIIAVLILAVIILAVNVVHVSKSDTPDLYGPYDVVRVVDGDTIVVKIDNENIKVRMIGIDTPESVHSDKSKNTPEGAEASEFTKELLDGNHVYLEYDVESQDKYGRDLCYVYLDDKETMAEEILLSEGLAVILTVQPNSKYADYFYELQVEARNSGKGFWGTGFFE